MMPNQSSSNAARLSDYLLLLRRHWWVVLVSIVVGAGLSLAYLALAPRQYTSQTSVLVTETTPDRAATNAREPGINLDTEAQLLTSTDTVTAAAELLDVSSAGLADLTDRVTVTVPPNTEILTIGFVAPTAQGARDGAQAFAQAYLDGRTASAEADLNAEFDALQNRVDAVTAQLDSVTKAGKALTEGSPEQVRNQERLASLSTQLAGLTSQQEKVRATPITPGRVITQPPLPRSPSSPDVVVSLAAGLLLGLLLGLGLAALRHRRDDCVRLPEDLERRAGLSVLAVLSDPLDEQDISLVSPRHADSRAYGRLRNLVTAGLEGSRRPTVVVAGVRRGAGPVAANLAASLARLGEDVYLVCADVFGHTATDLLGDAPAAGLAEVLSGEQPVGSAARRLPGLSTLHILGPGRDIQRADALLQTKSLRALIDTLVETAAYVVIEAPATQSSAAAQALAPVAETAVLVVEQNATTAREVVDAEEQFAAMRRHVLGAVLAVYRSDDERAASQDDTGDRAGDRVGNRPAAGARPGRTPDPALR